MTDLQKLREPFPDGQVGKLPRVWCKDCKEAGKGRTCSDPEHKIVKCKVCDQKGTSAHLHLDYVGHAEVTHRLLDADPEWTWEPFGVDSQGLPAVVKDGNDWALWIRLTVCGVTKPGVGCVTVERFTSEPYKQLISDAIRNASMRFGVALDLWAKSDLDHTVSAVPSAEEGASRTPSGGSRADQVSPAPGPSPAAETSTAGVHGEADPPLGETSSAASDNDASRGGVAREGKENVEPGSTTPEGEGGGVQPAPDSPEALLENQARQELIRRFNGLPLERKTEALKLKRTWGSRIGSPRTTRPSPRSAPS